MPSWRFDVSCINHGIDWNWEEMRAAETISGSATGSGGNAVFYVLDHFHCVIRHEVNSSQVLVGLKIFRNNDVGHKNDPVLTEYKKLKDFNGLEGCECGCTPLVFALGMVKEVGSVQGPRPAVLMEVVQGRTLNELVSRNEISSNQGRLPSPADVAEIGLAIAKTYEVVHHRYGTAHRDVHPGNIIVKSASIFARNSYKNWRISLIDFANAVDDNMELTNSRGAVLYFAAPEVFGADQEHRQGVAQDIWSIGAILYLIRTTQLPYDSMVRHYLANKRWPSDRTYTCLALCELKKNNLDLDDGFRDYAKYGAREISCVRWNVDDELRKLILDCTNPNPDFRPGITEVINWLQEILELKAVPFAEGVSAVHQGVCENTSWRQGPYEYEDAGKTQDAGFDYTPTLNRADNSPGSTVEIRKTSERATAGGQSNRGNADASKVKPSGTQSKEQQYTTQEVKAKAEEVLAAIREKEKKRKREQRAEKAYAKVFENWKLYFAILAAFCLSFALSCCSFEYNYIFLLIAIIGIWIDAALFVLDAWRMWVIHKGSHRGLSKIGVIFSCAICLVIAGAMLLTLPIVDGREFYNIAVSYNNGTNGRPQDLEKAHIFANASASLGNPYAKIECAYLLMGEDEERYADEIETLWNEAFAILDSRQDNQDDLDSFYLGQCYLGGKGVAQDYEKAFAFCQDSFDKIENLRNVTGKELGDMCWFDRVEGKDKEDAFPYYEASFEAKKANSDDPSDVAARLAYCHRYGIGVEKDEAKAQSLMEEYSLTEDDLTHWK